MINYISKQTIKQTQCKQIFNNTFKKVQKDARAEGLTFSFNLVGSAKRNMILENENEGFDCDYQLFLQKNKKKLTPSQIKKFLIQWFDKYFPSDFDYCEDSTTAITTKKKNSDGTILFRYDIVILDCNQDTPSIIKRNNSGHTWCPLPKEKNYPSNLEEIEGPEMWNDLRERYREKKDMQFHNKGYQGRKSFQILNEAINEILQQY
ncbi:MAG: hypothetical protein IJ938_02455 [Clostridia bacterium]|nr:hypothetical protein [Clostridia bacterium]